MKNRKSIRVLVVEDEPDTSAVIARLLRKRLKAEVSEACDLATARECIASGRYDLITLDQALPDGTGLELLRELREEGNLTPVIMVSAHEPSHLDTDPLRAGALDYILKDEMLSTRLVKAALMGLNLA